MRHRIVLLAMVLFAACCPAQDMRGPGGGFLFSPSRGVAKIHGIPGSAWLAPLDQWRDVQGVSFARNVGVALGWSGEGGPAPLLLRLDREPAPIPMKEAPAEPFIGAVNANGDRAAFLYPGTGALWVADLRPAAPALQRWSGGIGCASPGGLAVTAGGAVAMACGVDVLFVSAAIRRHVMRGDGPVSVAVADDGMALLVAEPNGTVWRIEDPGGSGSRIPLAAGLLGMASPPSMASVGGGQCAVLVEDGAAIVLIRAGAPLRLATPEKIVRFEAMGHPSFLFLASRGNGPLWILDAGPEPRIVFVPDVGDRQ